MTRAINSPGYASLVGIDLWLWAYAASRLWWDWRTSFALHFNLSETSFHFLIHLIEDLILLFDAIAADQEKGFVVGHDCLSEFETCSGGLVSDVQHAHWNETWELISGHVKGFQWLQVSYEYKDGSCQLIRDKFKLNNTPERKLFRDHAN